MKKIYQELARIQQELKAPKNLYNKFGNYAYRNAEGILEAVKPLLNGLSLIINDEPVMIGSRYYIKATVNLTDGEESVSSVAYAREDETKKGMDGCQITGACSSYARKYALNALLMIDDSKDSDDDALSPKNPDNQDKPQKKKEDIQLQPVQNDFTPPAKTAQAEISTGGTVPALSETEAFLLDAMKRMKTARGVSSEENKRIFREQFSSLVKGKVAPNKDLKEYTYDEMVALIDAMNRNFPIGA